MIPIKNSAKCKCIKEYVFNRTESFQGVIFEVGETYTVDLGERRNNSDLLGLVNTKQNAYVGISKQRFSEYFVFLEKDK